ncbi:Solitary outer membrane autotransporter beta-barrel domain [Vibrio gallicus]|uniref:Solitary outer membrane autotransporter beta-barrel domain n=1 Tax=Vibrio gallicus TaxID=190897 RepID=UPI0021C4756A|nr:Solitary outer membrane autotransporter beta-barrel domain [Vibrio gallicus]
MKGINFKFRLFIALSLIGASSCAYATEFYRSILEGNFATAVLLSDSDAFSFGFQDFDPNRFVDIGDDIGNEDSLNLRKELGVTTLPYTYQLPTLTFVDNSKLEHSLRFMFSYMRLARDVSLSPDFESDKAIDDIYTTGVEYSVNRPWQKYWNLGAGIGTNLMYFKNTYHYNNPITIQFRDVLDGNAFNTSAWSQTFQTNVNLHYKRPQDWGRWDGFSELNYFYGYGWGEANQGDIGNPEGLYWINGVKVFYDITHWGGYGQTLFTSVRHINLSSDLKVAFGTSEYWEASVGWLLSPPFLKQYVDNIGIGINLNYGSSLSGGTIILMFNQD